MLNRRTRPAKPRIDPAALFNYLPEGRNRALTAETICRHFKLSGENVTENHKRYVRASCETARKLGYLICSDENGYYRPKHPHEMDRTLARFTAQVNNMSQRLRQLKRLAQRQFNERLPLE